MRAKLQHSSKSQLDLRDHFEAGEREGKRKKGKRQKRLENNLDVV